MKTNVALVIIFNHRFDTVIPKLRSLYAKRFSKIVFLVPFSTANEKSVIPVYENSFQFQGFFVQAQKELMQMDVEYFLFVGDDVLLHPEIDESNWMDYFCMEAKDVGISNIEEINRKNGFLWSHTLYAPKAFTSSGVQWKSELPSFQNAIKKFSVFFDHPYPQEYSTDFFGDCQLAQKECFLNSNKGTKVLYPMAMGYSDVLCIKRNIFVQFAHLCGVFSAMNLFVEIAVPTSIVLTAKCKSSVTIWNSQSIKPSLLWNEERNEFNNRYNHDVAKIYSDWNKEWLFVHPVKLSGWSGTL